MWLGERADKRSALEEPGSARYEEADIEEKVFRRNALKIEFFRKSVWAQRAVLAVLLAQCGIGLGQAVRAGQEPAPQVGQGVSILVPESFHHYVTQFQAQELLVRKFAQEGSPANPDDPWQWMLANIPWFECSDANFQQIYYFRWFAFQKHIVHTEQGDLLSEFLFKVKWAGGVYASDEK